MGFVGSGDVSRNQRPGGPRVSFSRPLPAFHRTPIPRHRRLLGSLFVQRKPKISCRAAHFWGDGESGIALPLATCPRIYHEAQILH